MEVETVIKETMNQDPVRKEFIENKMESARWLDAKAKEKIFLLLHQAKKDKTRKLSKIISRIY